jgi:hypothetical protein
MKSPMSALSDSGSEWKRELLAHVSSILEIKRAPDLKGMLS